MVRTVVSLVRGSGGSRPLEAALEANAFAVAEDLDVRLVLAGDAVELALAATGVPPAELGGVAVAAPASGQDLRALIESGVAVHALGGDLRERGLAPASLVAGVASLEPEDLAALLRSADAVVAW
jgi:sulfur relay (sulfurtransferase) DsrF/TusC family protein